MLTSRARTLSGTLFLLVLPLLLAAPLSAGGRKKEFQVTVEDVLQEMIEMRRELRELKIERDRDQREIADLRERLENQVPGLGPDQPRPALAHTDSVLPQQPAAAVPASTAGGDEDQPQPQARRPQQQKLYIELPGLSFFPIEAAAAKTKRRSAPPIARKTASTPAETGLVVQDKRHHQPNPVLGDLSLLDHHLLVFHPRALDPVEGLASAVNPRFDRVFKALGRAGDNLRHTGD